MNNNNTQAKQATAKPATGLVDKLLPYWWLFLASVVVCCALGMAYMKVKAPVYVVASTVLIGDDEMNITPSMAAARAGAGSSLMRSMGLGGSTNVNNELIVMQSENLLAQLVSELGLNRTYVEKKGFLKKEDHYRTSPIAIEAPRELFDTLSVGMKFTVKTHPDNSADIKVKKGMFKTLASLEKVKLPASVKTPYGIFVVSPTRFYRPGHEYKITSAVMGNVIAAENLSKDLTVKEVSKKADILYLDVSETNVERGRDILNNLIALYNTRGMQKKDELAIKTAKFIDERLALIYKDLVGTEAEIESFKRAAQVYSPEEQAKAVVVRSELGRNGATEFETQYRILGMMKDFINSPENKDLPIPFEADSIGGLANYNKLLAQRTQLAQSAKEGNPALELLNQQIATARTNVLQSISNAMSATRVKIGTAQQVKSQADSELNKYPAAERKGVTLQRNRAIQNELYIYLLQKREENALRMGATKPKGEVIDVPFAHSEPIAPRRGMVLFVSILMGILLPLVWIYGKAAVTTRFSSAAELQALTQVPLVGEIPHSADTTGLLAGAEATSAMAEKLRYLRGNVQMLLGAAGNKVVLATSGGAAEGKTLVAANLAASMALVGRKVALVGMNLRNPALCDLTGASAAVNGVSNYLGNSDVEFDSLIQPSRTVDNLDVLAEGPVPPNPAELLMSQRATQLLAQLRERYDVIVIDTAPMATVADSYPLAAQADVNLWVARAGVTHRNMVAALNQLADQQQLKHAAIVLNDVHEGKNKNKKAYGQA